jgi:hypothetical protein
MKDKSMTDEQVKAFIGRKVASSMNDESGDLSTVRENSLKRYRGDQYGTERDGYSKYTTREVFETVEWVMPSILRVFTSGDKTVVFDGVNEEDEMAADQETDVVNHKVMKANDGDGFLAHYSWFKDALMYPNGYIKAYIDERERAETSEYKGLDPVQLSMLMESEGVEIISQDSRTEMIQGQPVELFDVEAKKTWTDYKLKVESLPPDQVLVDDECHTPNIDPDECGFVCHRVRKTYTQLVEEGFDREKLDVAGTRDDYTWNTESVNRLFHDDESPDGDDSEDDSTRLLWVHECYTHIDVDGDGLAEYRKIVMVGGEIFENEETAYQPIVSLSSIIMTHTHAGMSMVDAVEDLQELKTTLTRQLLDNIYRINNRRKFINEGALLEDGTTMDAMLNIQAEWIPLRGDPSMSVAPEVTQSIVGEMLPLIDHVDSQRQMRTGIAPNLALDPSVLQESTMGAFMAGMEKASERIEMLVRVFAETGVKRLYRKVHQLIRMCPDIAHAVKLRGQWISVDPTQWRERTDMTVNVGLGFNNKQQTIQMAVQLLQIQREAMQAGLADKEELYNTLEKLINAADFGDVGEYFIKPGSERDQMLMQQQQEMAAQAPPDPAMIVAQAQSQAYQMDSQTKAQKAQSDAQLAMAKEQNATQIKAQELQLAYEQLQYDREKFQVEKGIEAEESKAKVRNLQADTIKKLEEAEAAQPGDQVADYVYDPESGVLSAG